MNTREKLSLKVDKDVPKFFCRWLLELSRVYKLYYNNLIDNHPEDVLSKFVLVEHFEDIHNGVCVIL